MTDQEIKQAAIGALAKFYVATFLYRFDVQRDVLSDLGTVLATNTNGCEWWLSYAVRDGELVFTNCQLYGLVVE